MFSTNRRRRSGEANGLAAMLQRPPAAFSNALDVGVGVGVGVGRLLTSAVRAEQVERIIDRQQGEGVNGNKDNLVWSGRPSRLAGLPAFGCCSVLFCSQFCFISSRLPQERQQSHLPRQRRVGEPSRRPFREEYVDRHALPTLPPEERAHRRREAVVRSHHSQKRRVQQLVVVVVVRETIAPRRSV